MLSAVHTDETWSENFLGRGRDFRVLQEKQDFLCVFAEEFPNAETPAVADFAAGHPKYVEHGARRRDLV